METSSSPPPPPQHGGDMGVQQHSLGTTDWDWGDLFDFNADDQFPHTIDPAADVTQAVNDPTPDIETQQVRVPVSNGVRKRDPRLTCSNFVAGMVPCACPEMDALLLEEEAILPGKKRVRVASGSGNARCQVPGCEADIRELKGYHRRHKVCLRCASATAVVLDGQAKRYCQQCGKFHVLSDFDEGKRSCKRKLERHNKRRRRRPADPSKGSAGDKEIQGDMSTEDAPSDTEAGEDALCSSGQMVEKEGLVDSVDGHVSNLNSEPNSVNVNSDSGVSFAASGDTQVDGGKDDSKFSILPSHCNNNGVYSSMCPTGRISFKLYDWNPAEFPRRLRHQIFQWMSNMPVELEEYIRPGCTILTAFIALPTSMWAKLFEDPVSYLHDLLGSGKMLSKKGHMLVYLNNMIFNVSKDGNSVMKINEEGHAPRLHNVHPTCFEAGKPMNFVVCGSNLSQPKFRFLVSFSGKYLAHECCVALPQVTNKGGSDLHHQLYKILVHCIEPNLFGPAFIEVENESGLSNFIPILIGDRETCAEVETIQKRFDASYSSHGSQCEVLTMRQIAFSELIVDIAWLLKEPSAEKSQQMMTSLQIQRINSLLDFLLHHESIIIMDRILQNLKIVMDKMEENRGVNGTRNADTRLLQKRMEHASNILYRKFKRSEGLISQLKHAGQENNCISGSYCGSHKPFVALGSRGLKPNDGLGEIASSNSIVRSNEFPLLNSDVILNGSLIKERPRQSRGLIFSNRALDYCRTIFIVGILAACFGVCAVLLRPLKVSISAEIYAVARHTDFRC